MRLRHTPSDQVSPGTGREGLLPHREAVRRRLRERQRELRQSSQRDRPRRAPHRTFQPLHGNPSRSRDLLPISQVEELHQRRPHSRPGQIPQHPSHSREPALVRHQQVRRRGHRPPPTPLIDERHPGPLLHRRGPRPSDPLGPMHDEVDVELQRIRPERPHGVVPNHRPSPPRQGQPHPLIESQRGEPRQVRPTQRHPNEVRRDQRRPYDGSEHQTRRGMRHHEVAHLGKPKLQPGRTANLAESTSGRFLASRPV